MPQPLFLELKPYMILATGMTVLPWATMGSPWMASTCAWRLTRIALAFKENETSRTQEFVLRWSGNDGRSFREVVRQQWNFGPPNATGEVEEF